MAQKELSGKIDGHSSYAITLKPGQSQANVTIKFDTSQWTNYVSQLSSVNATATINSISLTLKHDLKYSVNHFTIDGKKGSADVASGDYKIRTWSISALNSQYKFRFYPSQRQSNNYAYLNIKSAKIIIDYTLQYTEPDVPDTPTVPDTPSTPTVPETTPFEKPVFSYVTTQVNVGGVITAQIANPYPNVTYEIFISGPGVAKYGKITYPQTTFTVPIDWASNITASSTYTGRIQINYTIGNVRSSNDRRDLKFVVPNNAMFAPDSSLSYQFSTPQGLNSTNIIIQNNSTVAVHMSSTGKYGATCSHQLYINGSRYSQNSSSYSFKPWAAGTTTLLLKTVDSRGYTYQRQTSFNVLGYSNPTVNVSLSRTISDQKKVSARIIPSFSLSEYGNKLNVTIKQANENKYNDNIRTSVQQIIDGEYGLNSQYSFVVNCRDQIGNSYQYTTKLSTASAFMMWNCQNNKQTFSFGCYPKSGQAHVVRFADQWKIIGSESLWVGNTNDKSHFIGVQGRSGNIYMSSSEKSDGSRYIYSQNANGSQTCVLQVNQNNNTSFYGNASTATKLATSRSFTIGNVTKNFDGSGNVSWSANQILGVLDSGWQSLSISATLCTGSLGGIIAYDKTTTPWTVYYRKTANIVTISCWWNPGKSFHHQPDNVIFTMPSGYRPKTVTDVVCGGNYGTMYYRINTNGQVQWIGNQELVPVLNINATYAAA